MSAPCNPAPPLREKRVHIGPLGVTIAIHLGLFALLLMPTAVKPRPVPRTLAVFDVSASTAPAPLKVAQPEPVVPAPVKPIIVPPPFIPLPTLNETVVALPDQANAAAAGGACDLTEPVRAALQANENVVASLPDIPRDKLSVANAIMIWKVQWLADDSALDSIAVAMIRDVVAGTIAAATPECRLQPQIGPRLLLLAGTGDTVVLAVGSGEWRWQDLLETARPGWSADALVDGQQYEANLAGVDHASIAGR